MLKMFVNQIFVVIFSILFLINDTSGLRCWRCSSDVTNSKFCGDTMDVSQITDQRKGWNYVECNVNPPQNAANVENLIAKCRILKQLVNDVPVYSRSCYWEPENVPSDSCTTQMYDLSFVKTVACNTCVEDGCNDKFISVAEPADNLEENKI